jgi:YfiH family protein
MPFHSQGEIRYFQFEQFGLGLVQAVFTRQGGASPAPWDSLNLGSSVGDNLERVLENRQRVLAAMGRDFASVYDVWQVHGVDVAIAQAPRIPELPHTQADAILTDKPGLTLLMRFADCVPVLLYDPLRRVAGIAHAGWMGTVRATVRFAVEAMQKQYNSNPADILAAIGPSIGPDHYEVGPEVIQQVRMAFGSDASGLLISLAGHTHLDLWAANRLLLERAGVRHVEVAGLCTACNTDDWFSHRAENGHTGRFGAIITLV